MRLFAPLAVVLLVTGCSTKAKLIAQGGDCLQATDCEDGLVCVPQSDGRRVCSNDLSGVQSVEEAGAPPREGGARDARSDARPPSDAAPQEDADQSDTGGPPADAASE